MLEQGDVALPAGEVAGQRGQQAGQQRGAQRRLLLRQRVPEDDDLPPLVVGGQPERVEDRFADERVGRRLDVAGLGERAPDAAAAALHVGQAAAGRGGGQHRGDVVVAGEPDDLLDQVRGVGQVRAPRRRDDLRALRRRRRPCSPRSRAARRPVRACRRCRPPGRAWRRRAGWPGVVSGCRRRRSRRPRGRRRTARAARRRGRARRRSSPGRRRARTAWRPRSAAGAGGPCGRRRSAPSARPRAGRLVVPSPISVDAPPMTAARPIGPLSSVISRSSVRQLPRGAVQGGELLPLARQPDGDRSGDRVAVEGVHRLAELEHHVVGDVDGERDAAHRGLGQAAAHPPRAGRGRVEALQRDHREAVAAVGVGDAHLPAPAHRTTRAA